MPPTLPRPGVLVAAAAAAVGPPTSRRSYRPQRSSSRRGHPVHLQHPPPLLRHWRRACSLPVAPSRHLLLQLMADPHVPPRMVGSSVRPGVASESDRAVALSPVAVGSMSSPLLVIPVPPSSRVLVDQLELATSASTSYRHRDRLPSTCRPRIMHRPRPSTRQMQPSALGGGGSARGVLSPTTTIASEDAFTPSLRAEESGHEIGTDTTKVPGNDKGIETKKVDASTSTQDSGTGTPSGIPKMVEARTQTEDIIADQDPTKEISSSISSNIVAKLSSMKMDATPKGQGQAKKTAMSATAAEFTPSSLSKVSTTTSHAYAPTASSTPALILSAKTQVAYIPTEINGVIHYVPTHVVLPASSPYSYTQHYPLQNAAGSVGTSIAAESGPVSGARPRKPCRITSPATNDARTKSTMETMNALAREFEPSPPKKDDE